MAFVAGQPGAAGRGEGCVVLISGDPGIGKSRLLAELPALIPELRNRSPSLLPRTPFNAETERYRLFEAVSDFLVRTAASTDARGVLLCLDDLHWADRTSLLLLQHLARKLRGVRCLRAKPAC